MSSTVSYKGETIGTASNSTLTLETEGTWLEDDITIVDVTSGGGGAVIEPLSVTENGTYTAPSGVDGYSPVTVNVSGGGGYSIDDLAGGAPTGNIVITASGIAGFSFYHKTGITSVSAPNCTTIGEKAFSDCTGMTSISLPALATITSNYTFSNCSNLTELMLPSLTGESRTRTINNCSKIAVVDLGDCNKVTNQFANGATLLRTMILRKTDSVATLAGWNAITLGGIYNNPTSSTIYVPSALISSYQTASNWSSAYSAGVTFAAIEGSQYE